MLLNPCPLSTRRLVVNLEKHLMFAEASELGFRPGVIPGGRLYDDACDAGITLTSHLTNAVTHWFHAESEDVVSDGETHVWRFKPAFETIAKHPHLAGWELHILND